MTSQAPWTQMTQVRQPESRMVLFLYPVPNKYCNHPTISQPHKNPNESEMYLHVDFSKVKF